jgi:hypothetical protein
MDVRAVRPSEIAAKVAVIRRVYWVFPGGQ